VPFDFYLHDSMGNIRSVWYQSVFLRTAIK
jgi:hypothetical protein